MTGPRRRLAGYGLAVHLAGSLGGPDLPAGRPDRRHGGAGQLDRPGSAAGAEYRQRAGRATRPHPVLHLANFALPADRAATTAPVRSSGWARRHVFIAMLQFGTDCLGTALYAPAGWPGGGPGLQPERVAATGRRAGRLPALLHRAGRPLCLYVVLGRARRAAALAPRSTM